MTRRQRLERILQRELGDAGVEDLIARILDHADAESLFPIADTVTGFPVAHPQGAGITPFDGRMTTVLLDQVGASVMATLPHQELGVYVELAGRVNNAEHRHEVALLMPVDMTGELVAAVQAAVEAADLTVDWSGWLQRERARRLAVAQEHAE